MTTQCRDTFPDTPALDRAIKVAVRRLSRVGGNPRRLDVPDQTIIAVYGAQGVIDNGGFQYFFENNWPGRPPYSFFSDAYRRIGAPDAARRIDKAVSMFPFPRPQLSQRRRRAFMRSLPEPQAFDRLDRVCGDASIWRKLEQYVRAHAKSVSRPNKRMQRTSGGSRGRTAARR
jgi:hypothetical protein